MAVSSAPNARGTLVWARFVYVHQLLVGAIMVAVVLAMPRGILGVLQQKYNLPRTI